MVSPQPQVSICKDLQTYAAKTVAARWQQIGTSNITQPEVPNSISHRK
jgi:hypothetical protein